MKVSWRGGRAGGWHLRPSIGCKIAGKEIGFARDTIVSTLDVDVRIVLGPCGTGSYGGQLSERWRDLSPYFGVEVEFVHVVEPFGSIKAAEENKFVIVYHAHVSESSGGDRSHHLCVWMITKVNWIIVNGGGGGGGGGNTIPNGYKFDRSPPSSTSNHAKNPFEVAANRSSKSGNSSSSSHTSPGYHEYDGSFQKPGLLLRTLLLGVDVLVATSVAMYSSAIFMDKSKFMKDLSEIPLVEGRSIISDELCEDFIDVYKSIPQKTWKKFEGEGDASVDDVVDVQEGEKEVLEAIGNFVRNCLRRQMYEEELRREEVSQSEWDSSASRHSSSIPIDIPHPGVPPDREVHIAWGDSSEDLKEERILEQHEDLDDSFMGNFHDWSDHGDDDDNDSTKTDFGRSSGKKQ
eukprot:CAMPEP_0184873372 /NCGR_PEP_ID=MMETSP0580-20130426/41807_1 /TAXON_ID=1118495 /ORGANISM="Dactyliosolen fragilissimus" /LENGTH=403 /DNA_ID=CAMNT_0027376273 /DNA_START=1133 /DNA_END=2344 /DNA_ORIENTATION=-